MEDVLFCCTFSDASRDPGVTAELLSAMGWDFSSRLDAESGETVQTVYFPDRKEAEEASAKLEELRPLWNELDVVFGRVGISELKKENWAESWKIHFKPLVISERLAIVPPWETFPAAPGQEIVVLNPGLSFGTGQHATTKFCLTELDRLSRELPEDASMLDAGCGSGILAIAAVKLGWKTVHAFDIDSEAVRIAKENALENGVDSIDFAAAPLLEYSCGTRRFDCVAANILSSALLAGKNKLLSMLNPGGCLILAGIQDSEFELVRKSFCEAGCELKASAEENGWRGGLFFYDKHR